MASPPPDNDDTVEECTVHLHHSILTVPEILSDLQQKLIETAVQWVSVRGRVVFITRTPIEHMNSTIRQQYSDLFNKLLFFYTPTFEIVVKRLTELQRWENNVPDLVIVESLERLVLGDAVDTDPIVTEQRLSLLMTCLSDTLRVLSERLKTTCHTVITITDVLFMSNQSFQQYQYKLAANINTPSDILPCLNENTDRNNVEET